MTTWLADASVLLAREDADDPHHVHARRLLAAADPIATLDLAFYEVTNVAVRAWDDGAAAARLRGVVSALAEDGGLVRADEALAAVAADIAVREGISGYDAAYVAAATTTGARLVSCDVRDLAGPGLALTPEQAVELAGPAAP
jgi:predicted nucleic acid-binding protein